MLSHHHLVQENSTYESESSNSSENLPNYINTDAPLYPHIPAMLYCLHLLYEVILFASHVNRL